MIFRRILPVLFIAGFVSAEETEVVFSDVSLVKGSDDLIYLSVQSEEAISGMQFEVVFDPSAIEVGVPTLSTRNNAFSLKTKRDSVSLKVVAFSLEGETLDLDDPVLMIPLSAKGDYEGKLLLDVKDFILSRPDGNKINLRVSAGQIYVVPSAPSTFTLNQNFPNPFNEQTVIRFDLPESALVNLIIYNIEGKRVRILENQSVLPAGYHAKPWDGLDDDGLPVSSGEYVCSMKVGINYHAMKMVLLR
ncbi:MAG: FlgD immunoglobulin-like domain containing protein [Candidatus Neomarinimicrobiota bacterium]|nr:FlgD immunoglobulin-like domain containing protein [Candidatus Neomarinimicrobiota bacterium]